MLVNASSEFKPNDQSNPLVTTISVYNLRLDDSIQARAGLNPEVVTEYAEAMLRGVVFPRVVAFSDGRDTWLGGGFHRVRGAMEADIDQIAVEIRQGTLEDARWFACSDNQEHGLRRSNQDKRRAVEIALKMRPDLSDRAIADHVGVSNTFVGKVRSELTVNRLQSTASGEPATTVQVGQSTNVRTGRDGRTINTAGIGKSPATTPAESVASEPEPAPSHYCPRCQRTGPATGCKACAELNGTADKPARTVKPKSGSELFNWRQFESDFGKVCRAMEAMANAYQDRGPEMTHVGHGLDVVWDAMRKWRTRLTGHEPEADRRFFTDKSAA